uniref:transcriptional activator DEMETER-like n=1 Tax=Erigeron canadensis TaxID=72917 RepID=UPI001CB9462D|nr:transcriptional activator DEMETER-like [Erigeron canadensis]
MNFERDLPIPPQESGEFSKHVTGGMPIPYESGIGHRIMNGDHMVPPQTTQKGFGVVNNGSSWNTPMEQTVLQSNGIGQSRSSWTPETPNKIINERSNPILVQENQVETENWEDLLGMYTGLLQENTLDLNAFVEKLDPTPPLPVVHDYRNHNSSQASAFNSADPATWKRGDVAAILSSTSSSASAPYTNEAHNNGIHISNMPFNPNQPTQAEGNVIRSTSRTSMLESRQTQKFTSNNLIDGLPVTSQNRYNLNSPPSLRQDVAASGVTDSSPFAPITPDNQRKNMYNQWVPENINFLVEEASTTIKDSHENQTVSTADTENLYNELLQTIGDSPPSAISTTQKEHIISENRDEHVIGLNETLQQKTTSRRKKHRPRVIREGKPKRTPTPKTPTNGSNEIRVKRKYVRKGVSNGESPVETIVKRKYVRRKGVSKGESPVENIVKRKYVRKNIDNLKRQPASAAETPPKSCKKKLNFDSDSVAQDESHENNCTQQDINGNANPQDIQQNDRINGMLETQQNTYIGSSMQNEPNVPTTPLANGRYHALNVLARNMSMSPRDTRENEYNKVNKPVGINNSVIQSGMVATHQQGTPQSFTSGMTSLDERRGIKRQGSNVNAMDSLLLYQKFLIGVAHRAYDNNNLSSILLENHKKLKMERELQALEGNQRQMNGIYGNGSAMQLLYSSGRVDPSCKTVNGGGNADQLSFRLRMAATHYLQKQQVLSGMQPHTMRSIPGASRYAQGAMISWNPTPTTPPKGDSRYAATTYTATSLDKKQTAKPNSYNQRLEGSDERLQLHSTTPFKGYHQSSIIARGRPSQKNTEISVDIITHMLEDLHINKKHQNGLVVYRGSEAMIPFEPVKKRNLRPKVDLDPETERLWRVLMGIEGSEGTETLDKDKEKWWENERRVFRGRADSFIARMHLVQGDRRFSRWKGSVVDSVIGVFLTQNVSDHLSSSAFMSLAARFPLKSTTTNKTCCDDGTCEQPIAVAEPNEVINHHEKITSLELCEGMTHQTSLSKGVPKKYRSLSEEELLVSQYSFDSSTVQTADEFRSSSGSNSETEDTEYETSKQSGTPTDLTEEKHPTMLKDYFGHELLEEHAVHHLPKEPECNMQLHLNMQTPTTNSINPTTSPSQFQVGMAPGVQKAGLPNPEALGGESGPFPSSIFGMTDTYHTNTVTYPQDEMPMFQAPPFVQYNLQSSVPGQLLNTDHQVTEVIKEKTRDDETAAIGKIGAPKQDSFMFGRTDINLEDSISAVNKQNCFENTVTDANSKEQKVSHEPTGPGTDTSKASKGTAENEISKTADWDNLRKEALANGGKKERSKDASDSIDYEALRRAHVNEISDAIKERGMNNLLADRMKDFLNRLVRDHGAIDLEWLRDAPPDKAKDYLLSFRGLGLKSVECVRLLTLHHLAFPVDTNVGRIAVRLGWVPLQPLPESLQLHLLEMYPVLETIQKYLWPRLCKLDQLTLYELHYQMITFGKVFCTKSKPNCNACPMRAECRHFASAFASARLSLPGPEEKSIVTSDAPVASDPIPPMVNRSIVLPLPPVENDLNKSGSNCEPIIEEPTTPEPEAAELSISDIEDQYYEDSDEIPSIKLNMEEFTTNLQNIMQDDKKLQDNMSKALVALNPSAASIPTPKLKDVSRLRTEHLVYELPDSHQLLEGLDKREPDDPSHYLLAIWTPGETANSVQPPEIECPLQQSGQLCDRATCFSCNNVKEANLQVVRGTILIPCRTAMRGSFPLNGTYFQVNEMFADHASSLNPIDVPRAWIWNLPRRTVYFGTSVSTIFKGLSTEGIQYCFWKGFVCVRGFDRVNRSPRPLMARLHFPASKLITQRTKANK